MDNNTFVKEAFSKFFPAARKIITYADEDIPSWQLMDMDKMSNWHKGKLVLIGDAAHPFLPCEFTRDIR